MSAVGAFCCPVNDHKSLKICSFESVQSSNLFFKYIRSRKCSLSSLWSKVCVSKIGSKRQHCWRLLAVQTCYHGEQFRPEMPRKHLRVVSNDLYQVWKVVQGQAWDSTGALTIACHLARDLDGVFLIQRVACSPCARSDIPCVCRPEVIAGDRACFGSRNLKFFISLNSKPSSY